MPINSSCVFSDIFCQLFITSLAPNQTVILIVILPAIVPVMVPVMVPLPVVFTTPCLVPHHRRSSYNRNHYSNNNISNNNNSLLWKQTRKRHKLAKHRLKDNPKQKEPLTSHTTLTTLTTLTTPHTERQTSLPGSPAAQQRVFLPQPQRACFFTSLCVFLHIRFPLWDASLLVAISYIIKSIDYYLITPMHQSATLSDLTSKEQPRDKPHPISISDRPNISIIYKYINCILPNQYKIH